MNPHWHLYGVTRRGVKGGGLLGRRWTKKGRRTIFDTADRRALVWAAMSRQDIPSEKRNLTFRSVMGSIRRPIAAFLS